MNKVLHKRSSVITDGKPKLPSSDVLDYGEIAINYADGVEVITIKNTSNEIIEFRSKEYVDNEINDVENGYKSADDILKIELQGEIDASVQKLMTNTNLSFFCIEPVSITINEETTDYSANTLVNVMLKNTDVFTITTTSDSSIQALYAWPKALDYFYPWLEGVSLFNGILFDMNKEELYTKWSQGNQGLYHVQFAQYKNCVFWSDLGYISDVAKRTNYTLYYSSELPLCYSTIPDNTFKAFYFAYNVTCDPNWSNPAYKDSFAKATWATQVFSYYGLHSIGLFDIDSSRFNITLPKDCRGLMYYAPNVLNAGVFDAINVTNFGAKSGSWRDAFACCYTLQNLYIKNLKVNLNISWSPVNQQSLNFILSKAANTNAITIWLSPHTYYGLTDANKTLAAEKNITLSLIDTNTAEDNRLHMLQMGGDGNSYLSNDGTYKTITIPDVNLDNYYTKQEIDNKGYLTQHQDISGKQDVISDLATIRANAAKGATALQSVPAEYVTEMELANKNYVTSAYVIGELAKKSDTGHTHSEYLTEHQDISGKQDVISDLDTIRSNAAKGATALQSVPAEYVTETELNGKGYLTEHQNISHLATKAELTGYTTDSEFTTLSNTVSQKADANVLNGYSTTGHTHTEFTTLQNNINTKVNASDYNAKINELGATDTSLENRITTVENYTVPDARANVLWIGTSIPAGDITFSNNGTTQSTTSDLGSNNYPKMVADALGFKLYNNARGASFVCFYPSSEDGTSNWAGKDWTEYQNEVHKGYSLSASMAQVEAKFGPNGLNIPEWLLNNFKSYSYESLIIPYIDGTIASCDTVILDHGYNDRHQILSETSWHISEGEEMVIGSGRDWLLKLQDPLDRTLTAESFFQGCWWSDENAEDTKKYYWKAMVFLCKKIWAVNPRIKIIIGNYFAYKSNIFSSEYGNDRLCEFICLANSGLANWLRCECVDVHKYTGIYNRNLAAGNDYQIFCPDNVHPHSDSTGRSNRIIAGIYINALRGICYN